MALLQIHFDSQYLNGNTDVNVIMPDHSRRQDPRSFYQGGQQYRVLWLFHGGRGDCSDWLRKSNIEVYACMHDLAVVMPSGYNSLYANWNNYSKGIDMEHFFLEEVMPLVYGWLPISQNREDNFIAGMAMGGQGAVKFILEAPERFGRAAIFSTAPRRFPQFYEDKQAFYHDTAYQNLINLHGSLQAFMESRDEPRHTMLELKKAGRIGELPPIFAAIGRNDHGYENFKDFIGYCRELGVSIESRVYDGYGHEWLFWDAAIQAALEFFGFDMSHSLNMRKMKERSEADMPPETEN